MRMRPAHVSLILLLVVFPLGCGSSTSSGGALPDSGTLHSDGAITDGGTPGSGGVIGSGGASATGGKPETGGGDVDAAVLDSSGEVSGDAALDIEGTVDLGGAFDSDGTTGSDGSLTDSPLPVRSSGCGSTTLPAACNNATTGPCTMDVGGTTRQYFVVMPSNYDANKPTPVVFAWHYGGGTAQGLLPTGEGLALYGVQEGFPNAIYIVPQGLNSGLDGGTDYAWRNTGGQDLAFAKAMVGWLESNLCVDTIRIFSTGMSWGGIMSETVACQMPDVFRAVGTIAGSLLGVAQDCVSHPVAAWITHGDADTIVGISGDIVARDRIIAANGCDATNTQSTTFVDTIPNPDTDVTCTVYSRCTSGNYPVVWCPVTGGLHLMPSFAGTEIARFFLQF